MHYSRRIDYQNIEKQKWQDYKVESYFTWTRWKSQSRWKLIEINEMKEEEKMKINRKQLIIEQYEYQQCLLIWWQYCSKLIKICLYKVIGEVHCATNKRYSVKFHKCPIRRRYLHGLLKAVENITQLFATDIYVYKHNTLMFVTRCLIQFFTILNGAVYSRATCSICNQNLAQLSNLLTSNGECSLVAFQ